MREERNKNKEKEIERESKDDMRRRCIDSLEAETSTYNKWCTCFYIEK